MSFLLKTEAPVIALVLFIAMVFSIWGGYRIGGLVKRWLKKKEESPGFQGLTALLFFLLAFTFGMSATRFDTRRTVILEEANAIGTAILRADLYPEEQRSLFRKDFKEYVEARITYFEVGANYKAVLAADSLSQHISAKLWQRATQLAKDPTHLAATQQMIPALNAMIDMTTTRLMGEKAKVPESIVIMLICIACISAFYGGYEAGRKGSIDWLIEIAFCLLVTLVIYFTLDLDRPRRGIINLNVPNEAVINLRNSF